MNQNKSPVKQLGIVRAMTHINRADCIHPSVCLDGWMDLPASSSICGGTVLPLHSSRCTQLVLRNQVIASIHSHASCSCKPTPTFLVIFCSSQCGDAISGFSHVQPSRHGHCCQVTVSHSLLTVTVTVNSYGLLSLQTVGSLSLTLHPLGSEVNWQPVV